ncbi:exodeoxyribonuclease VII large subunit [Tamlana sp. 2201CG12-4]|uniref:exodeoxyribonuclease VII large subunit n=1 Tax=Tamlana sp. 2201CG12-4 TaxID=3112582 RepID=UPI002DB979F8|nr:exodeoxyribonuclease VII large subunit [Tamlana sp. 2201CG12-4]MEC3905541.1 exodeoxyribonuclease VII large subunit [Tamlana sp. 2201CG12-4]
MSETNGIITVSTLQTLYANSLSSILDGQIIVLESFYFDKQGKLYGKYYYDELVSKDKRNRITVQFSEDIKKQLVSGQYYKLQGFITKAQSLDNDSRLKVFFRATKVLKLEKEVQLVSKVEYDIIRARFDREFPIIQDILLEKIEKEDKPIIDIITGVQSTSKDDYSNQLLDKEYYIIRHHKCNLSSKDDILKFLNSYNFSDSDLLIILRGGGSGLEVFNEIELCKKAIELPIPFITGIGHDSDKTLLQRVSDKGLSTPTSVGVFLQKIVNIHKQRLKLLSSKNMEISKYKKEVENEKLLITNQLSSKKKTLLFVSILAAFLLLIVGYLIYLLVAF